MFQGDTGMVHHTHAYPRVLFEDALIEHASQPTTRKYQNNRKVTCSAGKQATIPKQISTILKASTVK